MNDKNPLDSEEEEIKSRTKVKHEMLALQDLGASLLQLTNDQLQQMPIDEALCNALIEGKRITQNSARKRHIKFIGKLVRNSNFEALAEDYKQLQEKEHKLTRQFHTMEQWRDQLINGDNSQFEVFISEFPEADKQQLRQLIRLAQKEKSQEKPPQYARKLFKMIRDIYANH